MWRFITAATKNTHGNFVPATTPCLYTSRLSLSGERYLQRPGSPRSGRVEGQGGGNGGSQDTGTREKG